MAKLGEEMPPTRGQLERSLSQRIQALYREHLGHRAGKVTCQLMEAKLVIVIEDSVTQPEQILAKEGKHDLAEEVHSGLDEAIRPELSTVIGDILGVGVVDLLTDTTLNTGRTGIIAVLESNPVVRSSGSTQG